MLKDSVEVNTSASVRRVGEVESLFIVTAVDMAVPTEPMVASEFQLRNEQCK